jgi:hypothetical protein
MKYILLLTAIIALSNNEPRFAGNPLYDFPDSIIIKKGNGFGHIEGKMTGLVISGHYRESRLYEDSMGRPAPVYLTLKNKEVLDAAKLILEEAKKYRILLINEAHHRPEHRLFTKSLLPGLRAIGYEIFMAEGIRMKNGLDKKSYPISTDGYYVSEPTYGSLIRYAKKLKYEVGAYEFNKKNFWDDSVKLDKYGSIKYISYEPKDSMVLIFDEKGLKTTILTSVREREQAENILAMIKKHPKSKVVIHVGYGHLYEEGPMMGAKLRALLQGEDVLTIDQGQWTDRVPLIDTITNTKITKHFPFVLQDSITKKYFNPGLPVDYIVLNKTVHDSLHRPGYLFEDIEQRLVYNIPRNMRKDCPCLFTAYYQNEYEKEKQQAIAADIIYVQDAIVSKPLLLNRGKYLIIKKNKEGRFEQFEYVLK